MKQPKKEYATPKLVVHGTAETLTMAKTGLPGDAFASPQGRALGKVYVTAVDAHGGISQDEVS